MAKNAMVRVEGLRELDAALGELRKTVGVKATMARALIKAAEPMRDDMRSRAAFLTGRLSRSIEFAQRLYGRIKATRQSPVEVYGGPKVEKGLGYPIVQEFGSFKMPAHPFMRPAWEAGKEKLVAGVGALLWVEIEKTRRRVAARAERLALKMNAGA